MKQMFSEFVIAQDLIHPNIIEYKYFMRTYNKQTGYHDFHMITQFQEGDDMEVYLKEQGRPYMINRIKDIGGQILSAIHYLHKNKIIH